MGRELSSPKHQQINILFLAFITFYMHWPRETPTYPHRALELKEAVLSGKCKYFAYSCENRALLFMKVLEVLLFIYLSYLILKKEKYSIKFSKWVNTTGISYVKS